MLSQYIQDWTPLREKQNMFRIQLLSVFSSVCEGPFILQKYEVEKDRRPSSYSCGMPIPSGWLGAAVGMFVNLLKKRYFYIYSIFKSLLMEWLKIQVKDLHSAIDSTRDQEKIEHKITSIEGPRGWVRDQV